MARAGTQENPFDEDEIQLLKNVQEGSLIIVDECQKSFKPGGTAMEPYIEYLCEHRHHGLDFVVITQFPHLVHKTVRALVTKHIHVRSTWRGRTLHEWSEWQENPHTKSNLAVATTTLYKIPKEVFSMYESASIHTKVKHKIPLAFKLFVLLLLVVPMLGYAAWKRVQARVEPQKAEIVEQQAAVVKTVQMTPEQVEAEKAKLQEQEQGAQPEQVIITKSLRLVDSSVLWPAVAACVDFRGECRCYGDEGDRLDVPEAACRSGIENRWSGRGMPAEPPTTRHEEEKA